MFIRLPHADCGAALNASLSAMSQVLSLLPFEQRCLLSEFCCELRWSFIFCLYLFGGGVVFFLFLITEENSTVKCVASICLICE